VSVAAVHPAYMVYPADAVAPLAPNSSFEWMTRYFLPNIPHALAYPVVPAQTEVTAMQHPPCMTANHPSTEIARVKCDAQRSSVSGHPPQCMCSCLLLGLGNVCEGTVARKRLRTGLGVKQHDFEMDMDESSLHPSLDMNAMPHIVVPSAPVKDPIAQPPTSMVLTKRKSAERPTSPMPTSIIALSSIKSLSRSQLAAFVADVLEGRRSTLGELT